MTVRQAAAHTNLTPEGIRKARRAGRIKGVRLNEKEWGFYESELNRHLDRYHRKPADANQSQQLVGQPPLNLFSSCPSHSPLSARSGPAPMRPRRCFPSSPSKRSRSKTST